jgi:hypothetical protein
MAVKSCHETVVRFSCPVSVVADWFNNSYLQTSLDHMRHMDEDGEDGEVQVQYFD